MIESAADVLPVWMLIAAGFGFIAGEVCGDYRRHQMGQVAYVGLAFSFGGARKAKDAEFNYE